MLICSLYFDVEIGLLQFTYKVVASPLSNGVEAGCVPQSAADMLFIAMSSPKLFCILRVIFPVPVCASFSSLKSKHDIPGGRMHLDGTNLSEEKTPKYAKPATATRTTRMAQPYVTRYSNAACSFFAKCLA